MDIVSSREDIEALCGLLDNADRNLGWLVDRVLDLNGPDSDQNLIDGACFTIGGIRDELLAAKLLAQKGERSLNDDERKQVRWAVAELIQRREPPIPPCDDNIPF